MGQNDLEGGSNKIIPVPAPIGGVIVLGEETIVYLNKRDDETDVFLKAINIPERASIGVRRHRS